IDTVKEFCKALNDQTAVSVGAELELVMMALQALVAGEPMTLPTELGCDEFDCWQWSKQPPLPVEEPHMIRSAGVNNCGGNCKLEVWVAEGCVLDISADTSIGGVQLRTCPRGRGYRHTFLTSRRLRYPMKRREERGSGKFRRITYEEAAKEIAAKIKECGEKYGPGSRYLIYSTGVCAVARPDHLMKRLLCLDGGYLQHYNSYSSAQANYITQYIYGTERTAPHPADVLNSKLIILWGHNTAETIIGPFRNYYFAKAKEKGIRIVVIDPRQSESALTFADEWIPLKPGSDCALANAMAFVIFQKNLQDQEFMNRFCVGFDEAHMPEGVPVGESYKSYLFGLQDGIVRDPKWAEEITGVPAETIERIAIEYATTKPASIQPGLGVQRTFIGENAIRALAALSAMTGNVGIPGGGSAGTVTPNGHYEAQEMFKPENGVKYSTPVFLWSKIIDRWETMTAEEDGIKGADRLPCGIKLMFSLASNILINQHADINDTKRILSDTSKCELIVNSDLFYTPSVRWSDIVLPGASLFETETMPSVWN
ncbi:MAG: molybdopterin-dependent oxidoreductase, partial [Firmicutes bacterium]|nr:molybdopterin-dependent oxidoreductase [Bacillota bacterium]